MELSVLISEIIWKYEWEKKIDDPKILKIWRNESSKQGIDDDIFNNALGILRKIRDRRLKNCNVEDIRDFICADEETIDEDIRDYVIEHIDLIPDVLANKFKKEVDELQASLKTLDWHPGSNDQVLDLIHPSLYCYVKGVSKFKDTNTSKITEQIVNHKIIDNDSKKKSNMMVRNEHDNKHKYVKINDKYQWLPSEFLVENGKTTILSYINNLDEKKFPDLFSSIADIFNCFVPSFEELLGIKLHKCQVITKIQNIKLTEEKPIYEGGAWHLEGMPYENIIATGIYYYNIDNIIGSCLEFRRELELPTDHTPYDRLSYKNKQNIMENYEGNTHIGRIYTEEGKCIVFPNYMQHHVTDFKLDDEQKKIGTRDILVFFLIDPNKRIISTNDIPKQQGVMLLKDAIKYRNELMFARKYVIDEQNTNIYERKLSLCEH